VKKKKDPDYTFNHVKRRMLERYGIKLTKEGYNIMLGDVRGKGYISLHNIEKQKGGNQYTYSVYFGDCFIYVVYCSRRKVITTVLPPEHFERIKNE